MAHLGNYISKKTGKITWRVIFRKRVYGIDGEVKKDFSYSTTFSTEKEGEEFIEKYEHIFYLEKTGDIKYDRLMESRKRRFRHKIKDKT